MVGEVESAVLIVVVDLFVILLVLWIGQVYLFILGLLRGLTLLHALTHLIIYLCI
jgi:hypothetical protein